MKKLLGIFITAIFLFQSIGLTQTRKFPEDFITLSAVKSELKFIASDELQGRKTGEQGCRIAARYIAEQFRAAGLKKVSGANGYFQNVPITIQSPAENGRIKIGDRVFNLNDDFISLDKKKIELKANAVFAGFGIKAEGNDDYSGLETNGKIVVVDFGTPDSGGIREAFAASRRKLKSAGEHGAKILIELYNGSFPWNNLVRMTSRTSMTVNKINDDGLPVHLFINDIDGKLKKLFEEKKSTPAEINIVSNGNKTIYSRNVIGMIPGTDPVLKNEYILLTAHYDHLGVKHSSDTRPDIDSIYNGARDDGMGVVSLISAAKAFAITPARRSIVVLAVTGEEEGLLGSSYYAANPLIPLNKTVFVFNNDAGAYDDTSIVTLVGYKRIDDTALIEKGSGRYGLKILPDPIPEHHLFRSSDNIPFASKGIPAPTFSPGFHDFGPNIRKTYHQVSDQADDNFDFNYLLRFCKAYVHSARLIADSQIRPGWVKGDEYENAAKKLYQGK